MHPHQTDTDDDELIWWKHVVGKERDKRNSKAIHWILLTVKRLDLCGIGFHFHGASHSSYKFWKFKYDIQYVITYTWLCHLVHHLNYSIYKSLPWLMLINQYFNVNYSIITSIFLSLKLDENSKTLKPFELLT